ncbi:hypothetical protein SLEP1_g56357 [Rubroshorea leprosula]|uniref:Citrate synthase n=1 Tax=Rubroshorea leprosula TaxID=152421 RepID=A0AAV5MLD5_9ROSI|nr:hypothetical protein SLEP1_g56357 [Rubroshorea leprosula]
MSNTEVGVKVKGRLAILAAHLAAPPPSDLSSPPIIEPCEVGVKGNGRLAILAAHLAAPPPSDLSSLPIIEPWCVSAQTAVSLGGSLTIIDERIGKKHQVLVSTEGTVKAVDLKKITTGKDDKGLKGYDPGFLNTAPVRSSISYIDGDQGILRYRGYPIEVLAEAVPS